MKGNIHGDIVLKRKVDVYKVTYSYKTHRKNLRESSCNIKVLKGAGKNEARRRFYQAFLEYNEQEQYKKAFNGTILNVELIEETEVEF